MQGDGTMLAEVADVGSQVLLADEPQVKFLGTAHIACSSQEEERGGGQQRKKDSNYSQRQADASEYD